MTKTTLRERFSQTFDYHPYGIFDGKDLKPQNFQPFTKENVLAFIESEITRDRVERDEEFVKLMKDMLKKLTEVPMNTKKIPEAYRNGWNDALTKVIAKVLSNRDNK